MQKQSSNEDRAMMVLERIKEINSTSRVVSGIISSCDVTTGFWPFTKTESPLSSEAKLIIYFEVLCFSVFMSFVATAPFATDAQGWYRALVTKLETQMPGHMVGLRDAWGDVLSVSSRLDEYARRANEGIETAVEFYLRCVGLAAKNQSYYVVLKDAGISSLKLIIRSTEAVTKAVPSQF